jgi:2-phospho-L-lactate guanylyltransferase
MSWVVVVPVKGTARAKSRLGAHPERAHLAEAFALDTVTALLAAPAVDRVLVVTGDDEIAARMSALGAEIIRERSEIAPSDAFKGRSATSRGTGSRETTSHETTSRGTGSHGTEPERESDSARTDSARTVPARTDPLNSAILQGIDHARTAFPESDLAVVTGDLPALTVTDVENALTLAAAHERSMIPDEEGTGTTALLALAGVAFAPQFGAGSRAAHESAGHVPLAIPATASIRRDVDTVANLAEALHLGVGAYTSALIASTSAAMAAVEETSRIQSGTAAERMPPAASSATASTSVSSTNHASSKPPAPRAP